MFLYNVTIIVENEIRDNVREFIEKQLSSQHSNGPPAALLEMLDSPHEGTTYCVQLHTENQEGIAVFQKQHLTAIQDLATNHYPGKILLFDSTMRHLTH